MDSIVKNAKFYTMPEIYTNGILYWSITLET